jgi:hypothetical protein
MKHLLAGTGAGTVSVVLGGDLQVVSANHAFLRISQAEPDETVGHALHDLGNYQ